MSATNTPTENIAIPNIKKSYTYGIRYWLNRPENEPNPETEQTPTEMEVNPKHNENESETDIFSMDDSEELNSTDESIEEISDDWSEEFKNKKSCCDILRGRLYRVAGKKYTPLVTYYEIEVDKQWEKAEKIYNEKCTTDNINQTVDYYLREIFNNMGWIFFGMFLARTQKVNIPVYITDCQ
jgi:hypothetical protein